MAIREKETKALNETMRNRMDREFHWAADFPYVTAELSNCNGHFDAKVIAVKFLVTPNSGILIMPDEDSAYYEIGWNDVHLATLMPYWMHCRKNKSSKK